MTATRISASELASASQSLRAPFTLVLEGADDASPFRADRVLRHLPGRRLVAVGQYAHRAVVAKIFFGQHAGRDIEREASGLAALRAVIDTPLQIARTRLADMHLPTSVLLLDFHPGQLLRNHVEAGSDVAIHDAIVQLAAMLGGLHANGYRQQDPHLSNFLCAADGHLVAVDGGAVHGPHRLTAAQRRDDLALLLAQFLPEADRHAQAALVAYASRTAAGFELRALQTRMTFMRERRLRQQLRKCWRNCSEFSVERSASRVVAVRRVDASPHLDALLRDPDAAIAGGHTLKAGNTATVTHVQCGGRELVIKRFNIRGFMHRIRRALSRSRAEHDWEAAIALRFFGIPTPAPVAAIIERFGPLRGRGFFVSEYVHGNAADTLLATSTLNAGLAAAFTHTFSRLLAARIVHGDLKATNLLLAASGIQMLDLDAVRRPRGARAFRDGWQRDIARFLRNFDDNPPLRSEFAQLISGLSTAVDGGAAAPHSPWR